MIYIKRKNSMMPNLSNTNLDMDFSIYLKKKKSVKEHCVKYFLLQMEAKE